MPRVSRRTAAAALSATTVAVLAFAVAPQAARAQGVGSGFTNVGGGLGYGGGGIGSGFDRAMGMGVVGPGGEGAEDAASGGWTLSYGTALSATYSDNANLTDPAKRNQDELFLQVLPWASINGDGARLKARGYYAPALYTGTIGDTPANIAHFLNLNGTAEVVSDTFFVDAYAKASMVNLDAAGAGAGLGYNSYLYDSDNISQAFTFQVSPYVLHHLGPTADLYARLGVGTTMYGDASSNNALNLSFETGLRSGTAFQRLPWSVVYSATRYDFNDDAAVYGDSNTYQQLVGQASYVLSPSWSIDGSLGYSSGDYETTSDSTSGLLWSLGGTWTPNPRVLLSLGYGGRFYGDSLYLNYRYSHRRLSWFAGYTTQLTTTQQEFVQSQTFLPGTIGGVPLVDPITGSPIQVTQVTPTLTNQAYVLSSFLTGMTWTGNRTTAGLDISWNQRSYEVSQNDQTDWGIGARVSRELSPDLIATARLSWTNYDSDVSGGTPLTTETNDVDRWQAGLLLTKKVGRQSSLSAAYDYRHNLYVTTDGYSGDENRVSLIFNHTF